MVKVKNVSKTFHNKDGSKVRALRNVDIDLDDTGITFISGASGNGKSTLLSILAGLTRFDSGDIIVDGVSFKNFNRKDFDAYWRTYIGFVFEDYNLVETLNVRENIKLGVLADGRVPTEEQIGNVLKKVKLSGFEDRLVSQLSSGQRQRICIARTLIKHPRILFMDEPTAHLDDKNKALIWDMVKEMSKECLVISVSHDTQTVEKYADRIITLEENTVKKDVRRVKKAPAKKEEVVAPQKKEKVSADIKKEELLHTKRNKKHGLSFKYSFRMGLNSLLFRRWRTVFMVIICTLAVSFFGLFSLLGNYNAIQSQVNSLYNGGGRNYAPYVVFHKGISDYTPIDLDSSTSYDTTKLEKVLGTGTQYYEFKKTNYSISFNSLTDSNFFGIRKMTEEHSALTLTGIIKANPETTGRTAFDQDIIYGTYPATASDGVVISDYMLGLIKLYGLTKGVGDEWAQEKALNGEARVPESTDPANDWDKAYIEENVIGHSITLNGVSYKIAGVFDTDYENFILTESMKYFNNALPVEMYNFNLSKVYLTIQVAEDFNAGNAQTTGIAIATLPYRMNQARMQNIVIDMTKNGYVLSSVASETVNQMDTSIEIYKTVVIVLGVYSAIFAIIMMYYFISQIIQDQKNVVGVLKALGFSNLDISSIFLLSTAMFVFLSFVATLFVTGIAAVIANSAVAGTAFIKFNIMNINFTVIGIMFAVAVVIAFLGMIVPLIKFANKKPNEIMKGFR